MLLERAVAVDQVALFERPGLASARGVLIGVERGGPERAAPKSARVAGIRSFGIIGLLGGLWAQLASQVGAVVLGFAFVAFAPVMAIARWRSSHKNRRGGVDPGARAS